MSEGICGSCGQPAPYVITLRGRPTPACLRHLNHWRTPSHVCAECPDCLHDGTKCCGCYDGACCKEPPA